MTRLTLFALLADGSLLMRPIETPPANTSAGLKLCNVGPTLGVVDAERWLFVADHEQLESDGDRAGVHDERE